MPRTKLDQRNRKYEKMEILIWGGMRAKGMKVTDFFEAVGIKKDTFYSRMKEPENFTIKELRRIGLSLHIPIEDLRQAAIIY